MSEFYALQHLTHKVTQVQIHPGEPVDLSHCTPDQIQYLLDAGLVAKKQPLVTQKRKRLDADQEPKAE